MKIMFEDDENAKTVCEVISVDNGVTYIELDDDNEIELPNVVRFLLSNEDCIYIIAKKEEGNVIVNNIYNCDKIDLSSYKDSTIFYPGIDDLEYIESIAKIIFESDNEQINDEQVISEKSLCYNNDTGLYEY